MTDTYSTNRSYRLQTTGGNINTWGIYLNTVLTQIDANISSVLALNVGGNSNITLTSTQSQNLIHDLTGALTGNIDYIFPDSGGFWIIRNNTSGSYKLTAKVSGGSNGIIIPQGGVGFPVYIDTTVPAIYPFYSNNTFVGGTTAGSSTVQTVSTANGNFALTTGNIISVISGFASGAGMTLNVDSTGAKTVLLNGSAIASGNFVSGVALLLYYDGTNFQLISGANYAPTSNPTFTGTSTFSGNVIFSTTATGVTPTSTDSSTKLATTAFVKASQGNYLGVVSISTTTTLLSTQSGSLLEATGTSSYTVTLPAPSTSNLRYMAYNSNSASVVFSTPSGTIYNGGNSASTVSIPSFGGLELISDGGNWIALNGNGKYLASSTGYQKLSSGIILQWGLAITDGSGGASVTLPTAFPNNNFTQFVTPTNNASARMAVVYSASTTQIGITQWNNAGSGIVGSVNWFCVGN